MTTTSTRGRRVILAAGTLLTAALLAAGPASAVDSGPPVTSPDTVTVYDRGSAIADVLANDTDPDGQPLYLCGVDDAGTHRVEAFSDPFGGTTPPSLEILARAHVKGVFTFTYQACNDSYRTPGTLTVRVRPLRDITVTALPRHSGLVRVHNPNRQRLQFQYGPPSGQQEPRHVRVPGHGSRVVRVDTTAIFWDGYYPTIDASAGYGHVRHIAQAPGHGSARIERSPS